MTRSMAVTALLIALVLGSPGLGATPGPERDAEIQQRIAAVVTAVVEESGDAEGRVQDLRRAADGRRENLLVQLALFLADSDGTEDAMVGAVLLHHLGFTPDEKLAAVLPHLDDAPASVRKVLEEILGTIDRPDGSAPEFTVYEQALTRLGREPAAALIRYMYRVSPAAALASMQRVFRGSGAAERTPAEVDAVEALIAEHDGLAPWSDGDLAAAGAALERLAESPFWAVRLYVAATLRQHDTLGTEDLRARLAADPDARVRSVALGTGSTRQDAD